MPMTLTVEEERDVDAGLDQEIRKGLCTCFPADAGVFSQTRAWHGSASAWCVMLRDGEELVAHAGLTDRRITIGGSPAHVAGVQNVFVLPSRRGQGLCDMVMNRAMTEALGRGYDYGLLFCVPQLEKVYARCGWIGLGVRDVIRVDETGAELPIPGKNIAMFHPLKVLKFPAGTVHLQGNDW